MASGKILIFFALLLYGLVTLMPDIYWQNLILTPHLIAYPFVLWWQGGLILTVVLFLLRLYPQERPFYLFGKGIDRWVLFLMTAVLLNCIFAPFKPQAIWQGGICLAFITIGYSLWQQLQITANPIGLLKYQALLQVAYILESLSLWITQKILPYWQQLQALKNEGIIRNFDLNQANLHNAMPSGDSNYVAGYVMLALPLLFTLVLVEKGFWRQLGLWGFILGLIDIYSTSSFPGLISLIVVIASFLLLLLTRSRLTLGATIAGGGLVSILVLSNSYYRSILFGGEQSENLYRTITKAVALGIGKAHWLIGAGLGSTPLLYQKFRPEWAGQQLEMEFQLHSVPLQIFSELGLIGLVILLWGSLLILRLLLQSKGSPNHWRDCLVISIFGYIPLGILDYQLDVVAISISLIIYLVVLFDLSDHKEVIFPYKYRKFVSYMGWLVLLIGIAWVTPIDRAWHLSSQAFFQLREYQNAPTIEAANQAFAMFETKLNHALRLAPWETYYSNQLGWNLGLRGWHETDQTLAQKYQNTALEILEKSIKSNPNQEFAYHQSAWLLHNLGRSAEAEPLFRQALAILPRKASSNFGLGLSLIQQGKSEAGIKAIVQECWHHPQFITSPLWRNQQLQGLYPTVMTELAKLYQITKQDLNLAVLNWWLGKPNALKELRSVKQPVTDFLADTIEDKREKLQTIIDRPQTPKEMLISAWYNPSKRQELLRQAWINSTEELEATKIQPIVNALTVRMNSSTNFDQFLRSPLPLFTTLSLKQYNQRRGFGIMSRHVDGVDPHDLFMIEQNAIFAQFWQDLFPPPH